jgi:hypothetical protein
MAESRTATATILSPSGICRQLSSIGWGSGSSLNVADLERHAYQGFITTLMQPSFLERKVL